MAKDIMIDEIRTCSNGMRIQAKQTTKGCEGCIGCKQLFDIEDEIGFCDAEDRFDRHNIIFKKVNYNG